MSSSKLFPFHIYTFSGMYFADMYLILQLFVKIVQIIDIKRKFERMAYPLHRAEKVLEKRRN